MEITVNRNIKDSLFKIIFGDNKENALALYNAVNGTDYSDSEHVEVVTIKNAVYISIENDVAFIFDDAINLYEHQSTCNPNMPLRGLEYFSLLYGNYINHRDSDREVMYGSKLVKIPVPHYYVFYNGNKKQPERIDYHLSDAYDGDGDVEVIAHVININKGESSDIAFGCKPLSDYSELIYRIRRNNSKGMNNEEAVREAVESCIKDGILTDILTNEKERVISSLLTELTLEEYEDLRQREIKEGREEGLEEGRKGRKEGLEEGRKAGLKEGLSQKDALFRLMQHDNRIDDYSKSIDDPELYAALLKEYGIEK